MLEINYLTLSSNDFDGYINKIVDFYEPKYQKAFNIDTVQNSSIICLAIINDKIVGAVRSLSDLSRHGIIIDLMVDEKYRNQDIGSRLLGNIVSELQKSKVAIISLTTEPNSPKLAEFYEKNGFVPVPGSINMNYKKSE